MNNIELGNNVVINGEINVIGEGKVKILDDVIIDSNVTFITSLVDFYDRNKKNTNDILIKKGAYIGFDATILSGVTIGENSYIMPKSYVTSDVLDNKIVEGNPALYVMDLDKNKFNNKVLDDSLNVYFKGKDYVIGKDINNDLYFESKDKRILLAEKYEIEVLDLIDNLLFILKDKIKVYDLSNLDKPYIYYSSYYNAYYKAIKYKNVIEVNTDDNDVILIYKKDNNILFKRVFEYEINDLDKIISNLLV